MSASRTPDPDEISARRFGVALLSSAVLIAAVAFGVYAINPASFRPGRAKVQASGVVELLPGSTDARYNNVLSAFVEALQREDDAAMRAIYPGMSERDARILHSVRRRFGPSALRLADVHVRKARADVVDVDFAIVSASAPQQTRLPFSAELTRSDSEWRIYELH